MSAITVDFVSGATPIVVESAPVLVGPAGDPGPPGPESARTLVGPRVGAFTMLTKWRDREFISPRELGAPSGGTGDQTAYLLDVLDVCYEEGIPKVLLDGKFNVSGDLPITRPITIFGRNPAEDRLHLDIDPTVPGVYIQSSDVILDGFELRVDTPDSIANAGGDRNTCLTIGRWFDPAGLPPLRRIGLHRMKFTRTDVSGAGHAIAIMGRVSGVYGKDLTFEGGGPTNTTGRHASAILAHWGGQQAGVRPASDPDYPLIQSRFEPGCYSHHPNNLRFAGLTLRNTQRMVQLSAIYGVTVDGFDMEGGVDGGQILDLVAGDEGDWFAHEEDRGKVYSDIWIGNGTARGLTGAGSNANSAIDITGFTTSKQLSRDLAAYASAPYGAEHYAGEVAPVYRMPTGWDVTLENITFDGGPRAELVDVTEYRGAIAVRTFHGSLTCRKLRATGRQGNLALQMINCTGTLTFDDCDLQGGVLLDQVSQPKFVNSRLSVSPYPVIRVVLGGTSASWRLGARIVGSVSGARGELVEKVEGSTNVVLVQMEDWTVFDTATPEMLTSDGLYGQPIASQSTHRDRALYMTGEAPASYLAAAVAKGDRTISVTARVPYYGLAGGSFGVGQTVTDSASGNTGTVVAVLAGPVASGYPTTSAQGYLYLKDMSGPMQQGGTLSNGLGVTAKATLAWSAPLGLRIGDLTADFPAGSVLSTPSGYSATVVSQAWTAERIELWVAGALGLPAVGGTVTGALSAFQGEVVSRTPSRVVVRRLSGWPQDGEALSAPGWTATLSSHLRQPGNGVLTVSGVSVLAQDGELLTGSTGGSARVRLASAGELVAVPLDAGFTPFVVGEWVKGGWTGARGEVAFIDGDTLYLFSIRATDLTYVNGEPLVGDLGGAGTANIPTGPVPASARGGFSVAVKTGDHILTPGGPLIVAGYHRVRETTIAIEPAPFATASGGTVYADHFTRGAGFKGVTFSGGYWGVEAENCSYSVEDCVSERAGRYGWVHDPGADGRMTRHLFRSNGHSRSLSYSASENPRDLVLVGGTFEGLGVRFQSGQQVSHHLSAGAMMTAWSLTESVFEGSPSVGSYTIAPMSNGQPIRFDRNRSASGAWIVFANTFTPTLLFGGLDTGMAGTFTGSWQPFENFVIVRVRIVLTARGTATGNATIGGVPILPISGAQDPIPAQVQNMTGLTGDVGGRYSTTAFNLFQHGSGGDTTNVTHANFLDNAILNFTGIFQRS